MSRLFYHVMQDNLGNLLFDVSGTMRLAGTGTLATIYGDEALTVILPNPMTNHPSFGSFKCFLPVGDFDFYMAKAGYTFETLTGVQGYGSMAQQEANAVAITGGDAVLNQLSTAGSAVLNSLQVTTTALVSGTMHLQSRVGVQSAPDPAMAVRLLHYRLTQWGLVIGAADGDTGGNPAVLFLNSTAGQIGNIALSATTTTYNTTSDARLKKAVETLTGELDIIKALRPVSFRWNADDSPGVGFIASEVAAHVQGVITGEADAVDEAGGIIPQMIDYSKLVPFLVGAVQTLAARLVVLEDALGI